MVKAADRFRVLERARAISGRPDLDYIAVRRSIGEPLAGEIRSWLREQPPYTLLCIDLVGVSAVNASVAEELGPLVMQTVQQTPALEHRYPVYGLDNPELAYTFARAFDHFGSTGLAFTASVIEETPLSYVIGQQDDVQVVVLGQLSRQMVQILRLAERRTEAGQYLTSENLIELDFLANVSPAARSKRLTELYARRLLSFWENPHNAKERLFIPAWKLGSAVTPGVK